MRISYAPIKSELVEDELPRPEWQSWLSSVGTALNGEWRKQTIGSNGRCAIQGGICLVTLDYPAYPGAITLDLPVQVVLGVLQMFDENGNLVGAGMVSGKTITLPALAHTGRTIANGAFATKEG